jgi:hypothetical protein
MSQPPPPLQAELVDRAFSFYPPIHGVANNEWRLASATWSELLVHNTHEDLELAIPRRYFGEVSETDQPVMIVGLKQELEYKMGGVWPLKRPVLSMPATPLRPQPGQKSEPDPHAPKGLGAMMGFQQEGTDTRITKLIGVSFIGLMAIVLVVWAIIRFTPDTKPTFVAKDQGYLELNRSHDYFDVVRLLGQPSEDHWKPDSGELQYRALFYKDRGYAIILMGTKREDAHYLGAMGLGPDGKGWSPLHAIDYARGANAMGLLRGLKRF